VFFAWDSVRKGVLAAIGKCLVVGRDGSIGRHEGGGWSNRCRKIHPVSACWLEEVSVEMADGVGIGCQ